MRKSSSAGMRGFLHEPTENRFLIGVVVVLTASWLILSATLGFLKVGLIGLVVGGFLGAIFGFVNGIVLAALIWANVWLFSSVFLEENPFREMWRNRR